MITFELLFLFVVGLFIAFIEETKIGDKFMCWLCMKLFNQDINELEDE
jgi:hypothetical protein